MSILRYFGLICTMLFVNNVLAFQQLTHGRYTARLSYNMPQRHNIITQTTIASNNHARYHPNVVNRHSSSSSLYRRPSTSLHMFMGSDGGLLGIGGPEIATILLVGYFVLGPSELYKLVKEIGKFIQNIRTFSTDLTKTFDTNMNDMIQLEELRKAQRELNDAFSFRRTINVDSDSEAFSVQAGSAQQNMMQQELSENNNVMMSTTSGAAAAAVATPAAAATAATKRKVRRRVLKRPNPATAISNIPDLEIPNDSTLLTPPTTEMSSSMSADELAEIEQEFDKYTLPSWKEEDMMTTTTAHTDDQTIGPQMEQANPIEAKLQQNRFQQQLSGNWNQQLLNNEEKLEPIALIMNQIAILEQEKNAALKRLEEEYNRRQQIELEFYQKQRQLLDDGAIKVQEQAFGISASSLNQKSKK